MDSESTTRDHPDFAPMVVGHTESRRACVASAHDETREELAPGLHQDAQNVLLLCYVKNHQAPTACYLVLSCLPPATLPAT